MFRGLYGMRESGLTVPRALAQIRVASRTADIVLDPVCGSGTTAVAAAQAHRRFICIDREPAAVEVAWGRLAPAVRDRTRRVEWMRDRLAFDNNPMLWDCGSNFLVRGDCISVLRSMPDSFVTLVYADPPFNAGREFRNKDGVGFSDVWRWDGAAEDRLQELTRAPPRRFQDGDRGKQALLLGIEAARLAAGGAMASYLTWCALLLIECRRVLGSWEEDAAAGIWMPEPSG